MTLKREKKETILVQSFVTRFIYRFGKKRRILMNSLYTWIKVETGITLCVLLRIARTMSAVASPIVVLVYPFRHLTVGPLEQRKRNCYIVIVSTKTFVQFRVGRVDIYIHSQSDHLFGKFVPSFLVGLEADIGQNVAKLYTRDIYSRPEWD